jgi:putative nucleotidyltransferase with HDIG domain
MSDINPLDAYLDGIKCLPPTPAVMIKLIETFRQPDVDADEIVQLLRRDPALGLEVLRRCNNSFFGDDSEVKDVTEAVFRLGFYEVYKITVMLFGMRVLAVKESVPGFPQEELRRHSSIAAIAAGALAREVNLSEGVALTAGLLHDIGKLAMVLAEREKYVHLIENSQRQGVSLSRMEKETYGFNHSEIGGRLLWRWGLPEEVVVPVAEHNDPAENGGQHRLGLITNAASTLASHIQSGSPESLPDSPKTENLRMVLGLGKDQISDWEHFVRSRIRQLRVLHTA